MRSGLLFLLLLSFVSVFSLKAADFHCSGIFTPQIGHQHDAHDMSHVTGHKDHMSSHHGEPKPSVAAQSGQQKDHADCPPHIHSCCSSVFVYQRSGQINFPQPLKTEFSENIYFEIPAPLLEGPFQPPRLA